MKELRELAAEIHANVTKYEGLPDLCTDTFLATDSHGRNEASEDSVTVTNN